MKENMNINKNIDKPLAKNINEFIINVVMLKKKKKHTI